MLDPTPIYVHSREPAHLAAFIERIERLEEEKKAIAADIRDVYAEAKGLGFDVKSIRDAVSQSRRTKP